MRCTVPRRATGTKYEEQTDCTAKDMCCPKGYTCMKPRGGSTEKCIGRADAITDPQRCQVAFKKSKSRRTRRSRGKKAARKRRTRRSRGKKTARKQRRGKSKTARKGRK